MDQHLKYTRFLDSFPKVNAGSLLISLLCVILMVAATFTLIPAGLYDAKMFFEPQNYFSNFNNIILTLHSYLYCPQIPIALFAGALLGPRLGSFTMIVYVALGLLGVPVFAGGGGVSYIFEPVFGFIAGYILSAYLVGKILSNKINSFNIIFAVLTGVFTIHVTGLTYLITDMYIAGTPVATIKAWVIGLSLENLPYDIIFGLILCSLARPVRGLLWFAID